MMNAGTMKTVTATSVMYSCHCHWWGNSIQHWVASVASTLSDVSIFRELSRKINNAVLLEKILVHEDKKYTAIYGNRMFITVFRRVIQ